MAEQEAMQNGEFLLGYGHEGQVDDWFTLLNLGYRFTALGNSDTHGTTTTESGCPRNFVRLTQDDPLLASDADSAVKEHRGYSHGPFVEFYANGDPAQGGIDVTMDGSTLPFTSKYKVQVGSMSIV